MGIVVFAMLVKENKRVKLKQQNYEIEEDGRYNAAGSQSRYY